MPPVTGSKRQLFWIAPLAAALVLAAWWLFREAEGPPGDASASSSWSTARSFTTDPPTLAS